MKINVMDQEVFLDPKNLYVDEISLNDFLKKFAGIYNYYNTMLTEAQFAQSQAEDRYEAIYSERFQQIKESTGGSDRLVESKAKIDSDVILAREAALIAKRSSQMLNVYVKSLDRAHSDALNLGYNMRKEMSTIFPKYIKDSYPPDDDMERVISNIISPKNDRSDSHNKV